MQKKNIIFKFLVFLGIGMLIQRFGVLKCLIGGFVLSIILSVLPMYETYGVNNGEDNAGASFLFLLMIYGIYKLVTK